VLSRKEHLAKERNLECKKRGGNSFKGEGLREPGNLTLLRLEGRIITKGNVLAYQGVRGTILHGRTKGRLKSYTGRKGEKSLRWKAARKGPHPSEGKDPSGATTQSNKTKAPRAKKRPEKVRAKRRRNKFRGGHGKKR